MDLYIVVRSKFTTPLLVVSNPGLSFVKAVVTYQNIFFNILKTA